MSGVTAAMLDREEESYVIWQSTKTEGVWVSDTKEALLAHSHLPALSREAETEFYFKKGLFFLVGRREALE